MLTTEKDKQLGIFMASLGFSEKGRVIFMDFIKNYSNKENIKSLWQVVFGDSGEYVEMFLDHYYKPSYCYGAVVEEELIAMIFALPATLTSKEETYQGAYIYAVSTHPDYRGQGISNRLSAFVEEDLKDKASSFVCLVPAEKSLFDFYSKQGYSDYFYRTAYSYTKDQLQGEEDITLEKASLSQLKSHRDNHLAEGGILLQWSSEFLSYLQREVNFLGGDVYSFSGGYLYIVNDGTTGYIKEICCKPQLIKSAVKAAMSLYNLETVIVYTVSSKEDKCKSPFGMIKSLGGSLPQSEVDILPMISLVLD